MPATVSFGELPGDDQPGHRPSRLAPLLAWWAGFLIAGPALADHLSVLLQSGGWQAVAAQLGLLGPGQS